MDEYPTQLSLGEILRAAVRLRWMLLPLVALGFALGLYLAFSIRPVYRATVVTIPVQEHGIGGALAGLSGRFGGLAALAGVNLPNTGTDRAEAIAMLNAREFTWQFIVERKLVPVLFASEWNATTGKWDVDDPEDIPTQADAIDKFGLIRTVEFEPRTGLVNVSIDWTDPKLAADWANDLVRHLNRRMRTRAIVESQESIKFLAQQAAQTQVIQTQQAISSLTEEQLTKAMLANVRTDFAVRVIDPASAPDRDDFIKPRRLLLSAAGLFLGLMMASGVLVLVFAWRYLRRELPARPA
jgi:uncharacterized protein involved in exopolysaccharide biosynthesis